MKFEQRDKEMQKCAKNKYIVWCRFLVTFERLDDPNHVIWCDKDISNYVTNKKQQDETLVDVSGQ